MTARAKVPGAFGAALEALRAIYDAEIARLADLYRPRILAGEFSGRGPDDLPFIGLEEELERTHPWARDTRAGRAVLAVSAWAYDDRNSLGGGPSVELEGEGLASEVGECMGRDVLAVAANRGWVKRYRENDARPYALRVA
jgi:hypothetical protein